MDKVYLIDKYNNGEKYGYLTDAEACQLYNDVNLAFLLAEELHAGRAVVMYYANLRASIEIMLQARNLL